MRICYVCKAVDEASPTVATQVRWIRSLARHPRVEHVHVLTRNRGRAELPDNVTVRAFGARGWPATVAGFYREALGLRGHRVDLFFVAQGGPYPALLLPLKAVTGSPIYQWKAHPHISSRMRFYAHYCDDLIFTPTPGSFPLDLDTVRVVGHGIDTGLFRLGQAAKTRDLAAVGRIAAVKRLDLAIEALAVCRERWGLHLTLDLFGAPAAKDEAYRAELDALVERLQLQDQVTFRGTVDHAELPGLLARYRATLNLSTTAFDKAAAESMAVGVPVVTANDCTAEMLPDDLRPLLAIDVDDFTTVATAIREVVSWDDVSRERIGRRLRETIVRDHGLDSLFDKIIAAIDADRGVAERPAKVI
ncbi:MAG: glycosyltransferase family 4 protein [Actinobacteria bacterium]|nr:glycosyltransferase family 4 protein [Actinomycetota bacterium]